MTNANEQDRLWNELLRAAEQLLEAREDQMLTRIEWDRLQTAVRDCRSSGDATSNPEHPHA